MLNKIISSFTNSSFLTINSKELPATTLSWILMGVIIGFFVLLFIGTIVLEIFSQKKNKTTKKSTKNKKQ